MDDFPHGDMSIEIYKSKQFDKYRSLEQLYDDASRSVTEERLSESLSNVANGFDSVVDFFGCDRGMDRECLVDLNDRFSEINQSIDEVDEFCQE